MFLSVAGQHVYYNSAVAHEELQKDLSLFLFVVARVSSVIAEIQYDFWAVRVFSSFSRDIVFRQSAELDFFAR